MDRKKRNSLIAIIISLVLFTGIVLILFFFGSKGSGQLGPVARYNIVSVIVLVLTALGLGIARAKPKKFQMDKGAILGLSMLAIFSFIGLMIWLSSDLSLSTRAIGMAVAFVIAFPMLFFGIRMRRNAQTQQRFSWAMVMVWMGSIAAFFFVAALIQWIILIQE